MIADQIRSEVNKIEKHLEKMKQTINDIKELFHLIPPKGTFRLDITEEDLEILLQGLVSRKKILRGKIRNNQSHMLAGDKPDWSEKDFQTAINKRKVQLAEADMLKTKLENL